MTSRPPDVSLVIVPRERASVAAESLRSVLQETRHPFELVYVDCLLDEELRTTREHVDLCLEAREAGYAVYLEPESRVRYGNTEPVRPGDLRYLLFRWSDRATRATIRHFEEKWNVSLGDRHRRIIRNRRWQAVCLAFWPLPRDWFMALRSAVRRLVLALRSADAPTDQPA